MGKGDLYRNVDKKKYDEEWDRIFGDKEKQKEQTKWSYDANGSPIEDETEKEEDKTAVRSNN